MVTRHFFITVEGLDEQIDEVERIAGPPSFMVIGRLEATLAAAFADTQERVHILTSSLLQSGKTSSDFDGATWVGEIEYGGSSTGPINPVTYAIYEMARGGDHNFFSGLPQFDEPFLEAVQAHFQGDG